MEILKLKLFLFLPKLYFAFRFKKNILHFQITSLGYSNYPIGILSLVVFIGAFLLISIGTKNRLNDKFVIKSAAEQCKTFHRQAGAG